ncbi:MAG: single-stranded-DNA-specific exonuclease RecJ [bacterium]
MKSWIVNNNAETEDLDIFNKILFSRGIKTEEEFEKYFNPDYEKGLHSPFLMSDMEKGSLRIIDALKKNEKIAIYGDYDCDGVPATAIIDGFFKKIKFNNFLVYIPHRHNEGFGMNIEAMKELAGKGVDLIITVDNGTVDIDPVREANNLGMEVVITDHHEPKDILPDAYAIINPKKKGDSYPYKHLSGSGVAFKLVQALISLGGFEISPGWEKWLLDLVSIGTIADMVPLDGENRVLVKYGLTVLKRTRRLGLLNLFDELRINPNYLTEEDIGFSIAPRINAASRMGDPMVAFRFISTEDKEESLKTFEYLENKNSERKKVVEDIMKNVNETIHLKSDFDVLVVGHEDWIPGVVGLVAGKLADKFKKPVFVWGKEGSKEIKGSCRSDGKVNIVEMMSLVSPEIVLDFGGHVMAGGFSLAEGMVDEFEKKVNKIYKKILSKEKKNENQQVVIIDSVLDLSGITWELYRKIDKMAPFGMGNTRPVFMFKNIEIKKVKKFGKKMDHLQIDFEKDNGELVSAYNFFIDENSFEDLKIEVGGAVDIIGTIEKNNFGRTPSLRLRIIDVRKAF